MEEKARALKSAMAQIIVDLVLMIVWGVLLVIKLVNDSKDTFMIILYSICIVAFLVSMIINIVKYKKLKKQQQVSQEAMKELSVKLDRIINSAIAAYCEETGAEMDINSLPTYKTMNKVITGKLDTIIAEYIKEKRKNL